MRVVSAAELDGEPERAGTGLVISDGKREITIAVKNDLRMDMVRDWRRPRYTYDSGKVRFGKYETNGDFLFASRRGRRLDYTIVNLTKALYGKQVLFEAKPSFFGLAFDASPESSGVGKVRYWRESAKIGRAR